MITRDYAIFGKHMRIHCDSALGKTLFPELSLYPTPDDVSKPEVIITFGDSPQEDYGLVNPSIHHSFQNAFMAKMGAYQVYFSWRDTATLQIFVSPPSHKSRVRDWLVKMRNMQYTTFLESLGQAFHELVLVPSVYFDPKRFLVHASGVVNHDNEAILIGGTGGVGKTSLELELCLSHGYKFIADDISVVSNDGMVSPNLAFPKIYGYNLVDSPAVQQKIFDNRSQLDRLHWNLHAKRGLNRVRRRVSPEDLYGGYVGEDVPLARYYILLREHRDDVLVEAINADKAAHLSMLVIHAEYGIFHNQLLWEEYNRQVIDEPSHISLASVLARWVTLSKQIFANIPCYSVRIPVSLNHQQFKQNVAESIMYPPTFSEQR